MLPLILRTRKLWRRWPVVKGKHGIFLVARVICHDCLHLLVRTLQCVNATRSLVVAATAAAAVAVVAASVSPALNAVILNAIAHPVVLVVGQPKYLGAMQTSRSVTQHVGNSINEGIYPMVW
jgi:hypothetical protein